MTPADLLDRPTPSGYPVHQERHVVLSNGATLHLRPVRPSDRQALLLLHADLSPESAYARFLGLRPNLPALLERLLEVNYRTDFTLVAEADARIVAVAAYFGEGAHPRRAEVAFTVSDQWQGLGIGTLLLERLAPIALEGGIEFFDAWTREDNTQMLAVFRDCGFSIGTQWDSGLVKVSLDLSVTDEYTERHAARAARAAYYSIRPFFEPKSVAVVGASRSRTKVGGQMFWNLKSAGFRGDLFPVNPAGEDVEGVKAYKSVLDIPGSVDLAVVAVPAKLVEGAVDECIRKGISALVVISAGFAEVGPDGRSAQDRVLERVRRAGVRLVGPNCMGLLNTDPAVSLNATFASHLPPVGRVSMSTQSGALGLAVLDYAKRLDLGISSFVSVGNKADVSGNDLIQYWTQDENTDVILLYLESFGNPRKFAEIARRTSRRKPIVAVKAGRSQAGGRAAQSHTGALATDDAVVEALFEQCGVVRTHTLEELFDVAGLLAHQPLPAGRRVAILTNAGGAAILAADACEAEGLEVAPVRSDTVAALRQFLPAAASTSNPIDMIASASPDHYRRAIPTLLADPAVDSLIVVYVPPVLSDPEAVADAIAAGVRDAHSTKPVLVTFTSAAGAPPALTGLPTYAFPERAATALARVAKYAAWRATPAAVTRLDQTFDKMAVRRQLQRAVSDGQTWLDPLTVDEVLRQSGISTVQSRFFRSANEAVLGALSLGLPVAVKAVGAAIVHKSEMKAVHLGLDTEEAVRRACSSLEERLGGQLEGFLVQAMAPEAPEFLVGCVNDPLFGPVIACGAGGTLAELLGDVEFRLPPLSAGEASAMIGSLRSARLLRGFRGTAPRDEKALQQTLVRIAALVDACPEILEIDLNPVRVYEQGALVLDARIRVAAPQPSPVATRVDY